MFDRYCTEQIENKYAFCMFQQELKSSAGTFSNLHPFDQSPVRTGL
jgi:hypothetical protein